MKLRCLSFAWLTLGTLCLAAQSPAGKYADGLPGFSPTTLEIKDDGTFRLKRTDPVFPYRAGFYTSEGRWIARGDSLILNPDQLPRRTRVALLATGAHPAPDSVVFRLDYRVERYRGDSLLGQAAHDLEMISVFLDTPRRGFNIVPDPVITHCAFAPRVKKQVLIGAGGRFSLPVAKAPRRIGVFGYGFDDIRWFPVPADARSFDLSVVQPVEEDRSPRTKVVILKKNRAYFYEFKGKVRTGGFSTPLVRVVR